MKNYIFAKSIYFNPNKREIEIVFNDGRNFLFLVDLYQEFKFIPTNDLIEVEIGFYGTAICLKKHDLHVLIEGLMKYKF